MSVCLCHSLLEFLYLNRIVFGRRFEKLNCFRCSGDTLGVLSHFEVSCRQIPKRRNILGSKLDSVLIFLDRCTQIDS